MPTITANRNLKSRSVDRTRLNGGPASIWISRQTHRALREHAARSGQKLQWLADQLIARGLAINAERN